jgi:hypothetical protein
MRKLVAGVGVVLLLGACGGGDSDSSDKKATTNADTETTLPGGLTVPTNINTEGLRESAGDMFGNGLVCALIEGARREAESSETSDDTLRDRAKNLRDNADRAKDAAIAKAATDMGAAAERVDRPAMIAAADSGREACKALRPGGN